MMKQALVPYLRRLRAEALVRAALLGLAAACLAELLFLCLMHVLACAPSPRACLLVFGLTAAAAALASYLLFLRPTPRDAARRLDDAGLEERARTMVDFAGETSPLFALQREDALGALRGFSPGRLALRLPARLCAACLLLALLAALVHAVPYDLFAPRDALPSEESEETRLMLEMIDSLRARIEEANLTEQERIRLLAELSQAQSLLEAEGEPLEQLAQITKATGEITSELEQLEMYKSWVYALMAYDNLRPLAEAILADDAEATHQTLADMERGLFALAEDERLDALSAIHMPIQAELEKGNPDDSEAFLCYAFAGFAGDIESAAASLFSGMNAPRLIQTAFKRFDNRLAMVLSGEDILTETEETEDTRYMRAQDDGSEPSAASDGQEEGDGGGQGGEDGEGRAHQMLYSSNPEDRRGAGVGTREAQYHAETERVYEPSLRESAEEGYVPGAPGADGLVQRLPAPQEDGGVPYEQVYGLYYARLLDQIAGQEIPEDAVDIVEAYFYGM